MRTPSVEPGHNDVSAIVSHFDELAAIYDLTTEWTQSEPLLRWLSSRLYGRAVCLDVGTGTGLVGAWIRRSGSMVVGLDRSEEMLRRAVPRLHAVVLGDATSLPFRAETFDGAAIRSVLHYLDDVRCLQEIRRVLRQEGILVCAEASCTDIAAAAWWARFKRWTQPLRLRFYAVPILEQRLILAGFNIVETDSMKIARRETWEGVLRYCPATRHDKVKAMIRKAPPAVRDSAHMEVLDDGISYEQYWALIAARSAGNTRDPK
jgi:ubiquinone/menaquinone biosynthesis C-methylase UbiE